MPHRAWSALALAWLALCAAANGSSAIQMTLGPRQAPPESTPLCSGLGGASGGNTTVIRKAKKAAKHRGGAKGYDDLVVLCASYCDNAHPRPPQYNASFAGPPGYHGRSSDYLVWDEHLHPLVGPHGRVPTLVNFAYGGAEINNSITPAPVPDLVQQADAYLHDLSNCCPDAGHPDGKALVAIWIGINPVRDIWQVLLSRLHGNATVESIQNATILAQRAIADSISTTYRVVRRISTSDAFLVLPPDILLLPLPPAELLLLNQNIAGHDPLKLSLVQFLNDAFNSQLRDIISRLRRKLGPGQRVFSFDVEAFWKARYSHPTDYGLEYGDRPCVVNATLCADPSKYLYFDDLHPTSFAASMFAQEVAAAIRR